MRLRNATDSWTVILRSRGHRWKYGGSMPNEINFVMGKIVGDCAKIELHRKFSLLSVSCSQQCRDGTLRCVGAFLY